MSSTNSLQKSINRAVSYVESSKRYNPACEIINGLISSLNGYFKHVERTQSEIELENLNLEYLTEENKRLKRIIQLHDGNHNLTDDEISILEELKEPSEFYVSDVASFTLVKYKFVDAVLKITMPAKKERPQSLDHLNKAYKILTKKHGNSEN